MRLLTICDVSRITGVNRHDVAKWFKVESGLRTIQPYGLQKRYTTTEFLVDFLRTNSGPTEESGPVQTLTERTNSKMARKPGKLEKGEWREQFKR